MLKVEKFWNFWHLYSSKKTLNLKPGPELYPLVKSLIMPINQTESVPLPWVTRQTNAENMKI